MGKLDRVIVACFTELFRDQLKIRGRATALARMLTSRHTADLRWIGLIVAALIAVFLAYEARHLAAVGQFDATRLLSLGVLGGALSWAYTTANQRLGTIDLFACEISTLCRVGLVLDFARKEVAKLETPPPAPAAEPATPERFTSEEKYTPVFDNNLKSLEALDMYVVCKVTEFYTYRKTMMDFMRKARCTPAGSDAWRGAMEEMLYMQYLMFESARHAIEQLIEYDPDREESLINIVCSELILFPFLVRTTNNDFRCERLRLRRREYVAEFASIARRLAEFGDRPEWQRASTTYRELERRYRAAGLALDEIGDLRPHAAPLRHAAYAEREGALG